MEQKTTIDVWNEIRLTDEGVSITLYSESQGEGAIVEDETWFTFDEVENLSGDIYSLNLSDETRESLSTDSDDTLMFEAPDWSAGANKEPTFEQGEVVVDKNAPEWSNDDRLVVEKVTDVESTDYVIEKSDFGRDKNVADVNPVYPDSDTVVEAYYFDGDNETYAFPISRLAKRQEHPDNE